jgi:dTDP-4-dehydrorhamnose reductase
MRILITGGDGQLARSLVRRARPHEVLAYGRRRLDVTQSRVGDIIRAAAPDLVINTAAITDVDGCEHDPDAAFRVNALGARNVAVGAAMCGANLVQVSTDYVFSGAKGDAYWEFDPPDPISVYGASKLAGERLVQTVHPRAFIVRSAWLFGLEGENFVSRVLDLARERGRLEIVDSEVGSPTFCDDLADALLTLATTAAYGVHHLVNEGECSRYAFAKAILQRSNMVDVPVKPIAHYERPARPPSYAPLRNFAAAELGIRLPRWPDALDRYFEGRPEPVA